jgi:hypothetical protein
MDDTAIGGDPLPFDQVIARLGQAAQVYMKSDPGPWLEATTVDLATAGVWLFVAAQALIHYLRHPGQILPALLPLEDGGSKDPLEAVQYRPLVDVIIEQLPDEAKHDPDLQPLLNPQFLQKWMGHEAIEATLQGHEPEFAYWDADGQVTVNKDENCEPSEPAVSPALVRGPRPAKETES